MATGDLEEEVDGWELPILAYDSAQNELSERKAEASLFQGLEWMDGRVMVMVEEVDR